MPARRRHVAVVVLGDVGRSPRMQYHCTSLATLPETEVDFIGYKGERCVDAVEDNPSIHQHLIGSPFARAPRSLFFITAPLKIVYQVLQLLWVLLFAIPAPRAILVQNPPSIPVLLVVWLVCRLRGAAFIIDWHNFGYTVLGMSLGPSHPIVRLAAVYERIFARMGDHHICVTDAMRVWLADHWGVQATTLYDKPPPSFRPATVDETHDLFMRLERNGDLRGPSATASDAAISLKPALAKSGSNGSRVSNGTHSISSNSSIDDAVDAADAITQVTRRRCSGTTNTTTPDSPSLSNSTSNNTTRRRRSRSRSGGSSGITSRPSPIQPSTAASIDGEQHRSRVIDGASARSGSSSSSSVNSATYSTSLLPDRPAVIVSSTSWTADEDFGILLDALTAVSAAAAARPSEFPDFLVLVTGKGPLKAHFEARIAALALPRVTIRTLWLSASDYPLLLGSADLGVCLHTSTSGLDLPMKVVDMFGAGLPVCAVGFSCLSELVRDGENGLVFRSAPQLAEQLLSLFSGFPRGEPSASRLRSLRAGVTQFQHVQWQDNWDASVRRFFVMR